MPEQSRATPLEIPRAEFAGIRAVAHPDAYVALEPENPRSGSCFLFPRSFLLECEYIAGLLHTDDPKADVVDDPLLQASSYADAPVPAVPLAATPSAETGAGSGVFDHHHQQQQQQHLAGTFTQRSASEAARSPLRRPDAPSKGEESGDGADEELLVVPLPERFTDLDLRLLSAYAQLPVRTSRSRLQRLEALPFLDALSAAERALLVRMQSAAAEILPLPSAVGRGGAGGNTAVPVDDGAGDLPRIDLFLRLAALADFLIHRQLTTFLAGAVAHVCAERTVPELRLLFYPQLRTLPPAYYNGLFGPSLTPSRPGATSPPPPPGMGAWDMDALRAARPADVGLTAEVLAGERPLATVKVQRAVSDGDGSAPNACDGVVVEDRPVTLPAFFARDTQKRIREELPAWIGPGGHSNVDRNLGEGPLQTAFTSWTV